MSWGIPVPVPDADGKVLEGEKCAARGNHIALFELEGVLSTLIICHDERYPELVRLPVMKGARLVFYLSWESERSLECFVAEDYNSSLANMGLSFLLLRQGAGKKCCNPG